MALQHANPLTKEFHYHV